MIFFIFTSQIRFNMKLLIKTTSLLTVPRYGERKAEISTKCYLSGRSIGLSPIAFK